MYGAGDGEKPSTVVFTLERAACALFGIATFGVHLTVCSHQLTQGIHTRWPYLGTAPLADQADVAGLLGQLGRRRDHRGRLAACIHGARVF